MNVPCQTEILLLWLKIPVILDSIEFIYSRGDYGKWHFQVCRFQHFLGEQFAQETPRGSRLWSSQYFPLLRNIRISTNTPPQTPATRLTPEMTPETIHCYCIRLALLLFSMINLISVSLWDYMYCPLNLQLYIIFSEWFYLMFLFLLIRKFYLGPLLSSKFHTSTGHSATFSVTREILGKTDAEIEEEKGIPEHQER